MIIPKEKYLILLGRLDAVRNGDFSKLDDIREMFSPDGGVGIDFNIIAAHYNKTCVGLPKCTVLSGKRKSAISARVSEHGQSKVLEVLSIASKSPFLNGSSGSWRASFDWIFNSSNFIKILEGNYNESDNCDSKTGGNHIKSGVGSKIQWMATKRRRVLSGGEVFGVGDGGEFRS